MGGFRNNGVFASRWYFILVVDD